MKYFENGNQQRISSSNNRLNPSRPASLGNYWEAFAKGLDTVTVLESVPPTVEGPASELDLGDYSSDIDIGFACSVHSARAENSLANSTGW